MLDMWRYIHARTVVRVVARLTGPVPDRSADVQRVLRAAIESHRAFSVLQVGAYDGVSNDAVHDVLRQYDHVRAVLLEPQPGPFSALERHWAGSTRVVPIRAALSDSTGERPLYVIADRFKHLQTPASLPGPGVVVLSIESGTCLQPVCLAPAGRLHHVGAGADDRLARARAALRALRSGRDRCRRIRRGDSEPDRHERCVARDHPLRAHPDAEAHQETLRTAPHVAWIRRQAGESERHARDAIPPARVLIVFPSRRACATCLLRPAAWECCA